MVDLAAFSLLLHIPLDGEPTAVISHPTRPLVYALTPKSGTIHEINILTMKVSRKVQAAPTAMPGAQDTLPPVVELAISAAPPLQSTETPATPPPASEQPKRAADPAVEAFGEAPAIPREDRTSPDAKLPAVVAEQAASLEQAASVEQAAEAARPRRGYRPPATPLKKPRRPSSSPPPANGATVSATAAAASGPSSPVPLPLPPRPAIVALPSFATPMPAPGIARKLAAGLAVLAAIAAAALLWRGSDAPASPGNAPTPAQGER